MSSGPPGVSQTHFGSIASSKTPRTHCLLCHVWFRRIVSGFIPFLPFPWNIIHRRVGTQPSLCGTDHAWEEAIPSPQGWRQEVWSLSDESRTELQAEEDWTPVIPKAQGISQSWWHKETSKRKPKGLSLKPILVGEPGEIWGCLEVCISPFHSLPFASLLLLLHLGVVCWSCRGAWLSEWPWAGHKGYSSCRHNCGCETQHQMFQQFFIKKNRKTRGQSCIEAKWELCAQTMCTGFSHRMLTKDVSCTRTAAYRVSSSAWCQCKHCYSMK